MPLPFGWRTIIVPLFTIKPWVYRMAVRSETCKQFSSFTRRRASRHFTFLYKQLINTGRLCRLQSAFCAGNWRKPPSLFSDASASRCASHVNCLVKFFQIIFMFQIKNRVGMPKWNLITDWYLLSHLILFLLYSIGKAPYRKQYNHINKSSNDVTYVHLRSSVLVIQIPLMYLNYNNCHRNSSERPECQTEIRRATLEAPTNRKSCYITCKCYFIDIFPSLALVSL